MQTLSGISSRLKVFNAGPHPVWGLTAYMLDEFLRDIILKEQ